MCSVRKLIALIVILIVPEGGGLCRSSDQVANATDKMIHDQQRGRINHIGLTRPGKDNVNSRLLLTIIMKDIA